MDRYDAIWTIFIVLLVSVCTAGFIALFSYSAYSADDLSSKTQLVNIAGMDIKYSSAIPTNGTIIGFKYGGSLNDQFNLWLQAAKLANATSVYDVPKTDWSLTYRGEALYFVNDNTIYVYQ